MQQAQAVGYDAILLDWMLPQFDGLHVCRTLRSSGCKTPIILLTARGETEEKVLGLDAGADDYLTKPFDLSELLARVRACTRRRGAENVVRVGPLVVDRSQRTTRVEGRALELTPREFALLSYLVRQAGRIVPRTELLSKVWEANFDPSSNVIDVHVRNLREKLGSQASMLETVRGVGYRLAPIQSHEAQ
jgi:DNA-binding response OmpR family regulator